MAIRKRLFCDTNILLDMLDPQRLFHMDALALLWYAQENASSVQLIASITSFKDAYYILNRLYKDEARARDTISTLMEQYVVPVDMLAAYGARAIASKEPDFEDGLIAQCAQNEGASALITRDAAAFAYCTMLVCTAAEYLKRAGFDYEVIDF